MSFMGLLSEQIMNRWTFERAERLIVRFVGLISLLLVGAKIILNEFRGLW